MPIFAPPFRSSTPRRLIAAFFGLATGVAAAAPAAAVDWTLLPEKSRLIFEYDEDGAPQRGGFSRFSGRGGFSRSDPSASRFTLTIDVASIDLADKFRTDFVQSEAWLNSRRFPEARYELTTLRLIEGDRFEAIGALSVKDVSREIRAPVTLTVSGATARVTGALKFNRFDFHLGDRLGNLFVDIGDDISVRFELIAERR